MEDKKVEGRKKTDYKKIGKMDYKGKVEKKAPVRKCFDEDEDEYGDDE